MYSTEEWKGMVRHKGNRAWLEQWICIRRTTRGLHYNNVLTSNSVLEYSDFSGEDWAALAMSWCRSNDGESASISSTSLSASNEVCGTNDALVWSRCVFNTRLNLFWYLKSTRPALIAAKSCCWLRRTATLMAPTTQKVRY